MQSQQPRYINESMLFKDRYLSVIILYNPFPSGNHFNHWFSEQILFSDWWHMGRSTVVSNCKSIYLLGSKLKRVNTPVGRISLMERSTLLMVLRSECRLLFPHCHKKTFSCYWSLLAGPKRLALGWAHVCSPFNECSYPFLFKIKVFFDITIYCVF